MIEAKKITTPTKSNPVFGGPDSSDPECPGAQRIALINRPIDATRLP
jgi:hypothetical protein